MPLPDPSAEPIVGNDPSIDVVGNPASKSVSYRDAGVDIDRATRSLSAIANLARSTATSDGSGAIGHFGGTYRLAGGGDRLLVASADGIGTKIKLAFVLGGEAHRRVGADLVNHCVGDILACGARPLFFLDYIAMASIDGAVLESLVAGMADACRQNTVALIGGETAEMPGLYAPGEYDAAGFIVGEVEPDRYIDGSRIQEGDLLIGLPSSGLHTNGYSLARFILGLSGDADHDREILARPIPSSGAGSIGDALLQPHLSYFPAVFPLVELGIVRGIAHITGGGLLDNVPRMLPDGFVACFDQSTWHVPPIFEYLVDIGRVDARERYRTFNMGLGMVLAVDPSDRDLALDRIPGAMVAGVVTARGEGPPVVIEGTSAGTVR